MPQHPRRRTVFEVDEKFIIGKSLVLFSEQTFINFIPGREVFIPSIPIVFASAAAYAVVDATALYVQVRERYTSHKTKSVIRTWRPGNRSISYFLWPIVFSAYSAATTNAKGHSPFHLFFAAVD